MYLSSSIQAQSVILKLIQITLLLVIIGMVISPAFAQQFREPDYTISGAKVIDFILDPEAKTLTISLDVKSRGEITITLLRNIIDARDEAKDKEFTVKVNGLEYLFFDETITPVDRTITIPFGKNESEIVIFGTHVFSEGTTEPTEQSQDLIEQKAQKAENDLLRIEVEARQRAAQAEGVAAANIAEAAGEAEAIRVINEALTNNPHYLEWLKTQKWDGVLPLVVGEGGTPFIQIPTK